MDLDIFNGNFHTLKQYVAQKNINIPDSLFIKNIENVQGDERDVIIFSLTHAPYKDGKFAMQFGSLNAQKGENRLNVAVTRAKEKIFMVSSIMPQQMKHGPQNLRAILVLHMSLEWCLIVQAIFTHLLILQIQQPIKEKL